MFLNKINQNKLTIKNFKTAKYNLDLNLIKKSLKKKYVLIYYYDFLSLEQQSQIKNILNENELELIKIKKNLLIMHLRKLKIKFLLNIIQNNTFIIINKNNNFFDSKPYYKLNNIKNIYLMGAYINKQFLRPSQLKKLTAISKKIINKQTIQIIDLKKNCIRKAIVLKQN